MALAGYFRMYSNFEADATDEQHMPGCQTGKQVMSAPKSADQNIQASPDDEEIIKLVLRGNHNLFRKLISRHQNMVFSMIMRQTGNPSIAEELTQESFIKAFSQLKSFRAEARFSTWIVRIALNHTHSYYSSRAFKQSARSESFDLSCHDQADLKLVEQRRLQEELSKLRECLALLQPIHREVITLCGLEGKSYEEAAEIIEVPVGTIRSRLNKARLKLKDCFLRYEQAEEEKSDGESAK